MDWQVELGLVLRALMALVLGGFIGWEREKSPRAAGIRTYAAISLGACIFGLVSFHVGNTSSPEYIAAQVVSGMGFLGAGVILKEKGRVLGLTTAATMWAAAGIGLAVAASMYVLATLGAALIFLLLSMPMIPGWETLRDTAPERSDDDSGPSTEVR